RKNPSSKVIQILSAICFPKTDNIVNATRGGFWRAKGAKRWVNSDEGFLRLTTCFLFLVEIA
ncbi:MAG: hypothetical protein KDK71_07870, partial [Chlamydiia bacterium]|nr:hypothetical protein [Chlamydiia bacterium]